MKTLRNLSRTEIFELAKQLGLKVITDADYIYVFEFKSNDGLRANDVSVPSSYNMWSYQSYGKTVALDALKSDKIIKFIEKIQNL